MKTHLVKLVVSIIYVGTLLGCGNNYAPSPQMNTQLSQKGLNLNAICNSIEGGVSSDSGCNHEITQEHINLAIEFRDTCNKIEGMFNSEQMSCLAYTGYSLKSTPTKYTLNGFKKNLSNSLDLYKDFEKEKEKNLIWAEKAKKFNSIEDLCNSFSEKPYYNEKTRTCKFNNNIIPNEYIFMEKLVRDKDNQILKKILEAKKIKEDAWKEEAKLFNGSIKELCESITTKNNTYNENSLECTIVEPISKEKYDTMKPIVIERLQKLIIEKKELEKRELERKIKQKEEDELNKKEEEKKKEELRTIELKEAFKEKWRNRVNKAKQVEQGKSYICETNAYGNTTNSIFSLVSAPLSVGENSIEFNGIILYLRDDYTSYYLAEGYNYSNNKIIRGKLFKGKGLKDSPYNLEISGVGFFCE